MVTMLYQYSISVSYGTVFFSRRTAPFEHISNPECFVNDLFYLFNTALVRQESSKDLSSTGFNVGKLSINKQRAMSALKAVKQVSSVAPQFYG
ncbi:hypothetical protein RRG08_045401 [Elysia crispata]|uniref:Uncharacterized protein n=1 Tax=Elysia crispata TaxID=231223 RepID=A0AAE1AN69_9GAST|nr:hypothetical protein RRG08_045401 [Elysia crispata]